MQLIVLAAGSGTRFGGVKQLAAVGPRGEAILDVLLARAATAGFTDAVVVTSPAVEDRMRTHLATHPDPLPVEVVLQAAPLGTADAVLAARDAITGEFAVVNADDLYPPTAFAMLGEPQLEAWDALLVAFRVGQTLIGARPVKRALLAIDDDGNLTHITESTVSTDDVRGDEWVSMNMWAFPTSVLEVLDRAMRSAAASGSTAEVLLPDVASAMVGEGATVRALCCEEPCIGITYAEDVAVVKVALS